MNFRIRCLLEVVGQFVKSGCRILGDRLGVNGIGAGWSLCGAQDLLVEVPVGVNVFDVDVIEPPIIRSGGCDENAQK